MKMVLAMMALLLTQLGAPASAAESGGKVKAPELQPKIPPYSLESRDFIFPSGLRVIMQPDHSAPIVAVTTVFDRGSTSDPVGKEGIAHFVEHLWFKSRHVEGSDVRAWDILSENGCLLNASTSNDWTNYMTVCPDTALRTLLKFASLRMTDPVKGVVAHEVTSEREVIRNELRMRMENSGGDVLRYIYDRIYGPAHPYHRLTIGTHGSLDNITLEDIQQFTVEHYRPENATIVVVGDFEPDFAFSLIFENFAPELLHPDLTEENMRWYPRPGVEWDQINRSNPDPELVYWTASDPADDSKPLPLLKTPPHRSATFGMAPTDEAYNTEVGIFDAPVERRTVILGWSAPGGWQGNDSTMRIAANMVANTIGPGVYDDRRFRRDPNTKALQLGCYASPSKANTTILCFAEITEDADAEQMVERMLDQLSQAWNPEMLANPIMRQMRENSFALLRMGGLQYVLSSLDRVYGLYGARATDIAMYAHHTGSHRFHSDTMNEQSDLDFDSAVLFARQWITRDRAAAVVLNPLPEEDLVLDNSESDYHGAGQSEDRVVSSLDPESITADLIHEEVRLPDFDKMIDTTLDNGLRVIVLPHGEVPWMTARVFAAGGTDTDPLGKDTAARWFRRDPATEILPRLNPFDPLLPELNP